MLLLTDNFNIMRFTDLEAMQVHADQAQKAGNLQMDERHDIGIINSTSSTDVELYMTNFFRLINKMSDIYFGCGLLDAGYVPVTYCPSTYMNPQRCDLVAREFSLRGIYTIRQKANSLIDPQIYIPNTGNVQEVWVHRYELAKLLGCSLMDAGALKFFTDFKFECLDKVKDTKARNMIELYEGGI